MTIFETERLVVRAWTDDERDVARIFDIYSRPEVTQWLGNPTPLATLEQAGLEEIFAVVRPDNERSLAVCRRLGMISLGRSTRWYDLELEVFQSRRQ